ncbi:GNAT family N-acetyltransferase [Shewanella abyssi]|uniref:GNAT family N-acetyltransferase n=1 Tax=Shewanella abyssi TaxID=311789 RepID=UPI00200DEBA1|nr:GNAT family protein [Shewanella abyssi]MCL1048186.1 GNAT family N-acetyltransferase [Shewanella abyssi]
MSTLIELDNLIIRQFEQNDLHIFARYRAVPDVAKYQSWSDYSYEKATHLFDSMQGHEFGAVGQWFQLAIADKQSNALLGDLAIHFIDAEQVEVGFTLAPENQGKGIAAKSVAAFIDYLFDTMNKYRIVATTDCDNHPSYRLLERVGFRREAHFVNNIFFKGQWGSEYQYAMLQSDRA